jgi:hypothetical protein
MRKLLIVLGIGVLLLAACQSDPTPDAAVTQAAQPTVEATAATPTPPPAPTVTPEILPNPDDPLVLVLGGDFDNGGYWTWDDISNLLGVYAGYGAYSTVTAAGQSYTGVPLPYLLEYARPNPNVDSVIVFDRETTRTDYGIDDVTDCMDCLVVRAEDDSLTLVFPEAATPVITHAMRIDVR